MMTATLSKTMTDSELRQAIQEELGWQPSIDDRDIGVSVKEGIATLTGTVGNFFVKWEAGSAARRIHGIMAVVNDVEVQLPGDRRRTDTDVARAAAEALAWDVSLPADSVKVTVSDGWITLSGEVDWGYQKHAAHVAVRRLLGARGVTDEIAVKPSAVPGDIKAGIEAAFRRNAAVDSQGIQVEAEGGRVTLRGSVRTWMERDEAERSAWGAHGITCVDNLISLGSPCY